MKIKFEQHACAFVMDQTSPGMTGGDVTEEAGMWIYVFRTLKSDSWRFTQYMYVSIVLVLVT